MTIYIPKPFLIAIMVAIALFLIVRFNPVNVIEAQGGQAFVVRTGTFIPERFPMPIFTERSQMSQLLGHIPIGQATRVFYPKRSGENRFWMALDEAGTQWIPVHSVGVCPETLLGQLIPDTP